MTKKSGISSRTNGKTQARTGRKRGALNIDKAYLLGLVTKIRPTNMKKWDKVAVDYCTGKQLF